ncbi:hypothetical protein VaNZ11_010837 [Volvox africanus]|uniref:J domain-containing protein n=1 Tax=Volvox africanus TaxID=51714 RepID=A0ABQ5SBL7_9CHLO|nr:hypothetical protein VaNZ11_010837 [Volvox africanus]
MVGREGIEMAAGASGDLARAADDPGEAALQPPYSLTVRRVSELLAEGHWAQCEQLLDSELSSPPSTAAEARDLLRALVVAKVHRVSYDMASTTAFEEAVVAANGTCRRHVGCSTDGSGWDGNGSGSAAAAEEVLRWATVRLSGSGGGGGGVRLAPPPPLSSSQVRSWFRRLAALVHPDKCRTTHAVPDAVAASAFRLLQEGCDALIADLRREEEGRRDHSGGGGGGGRKRSREACYDGGGGRRSDGGDKEADNDDDDGDNGVWWAEWRHGRQPPSYGSDWWFPSTCPTAQDEEPALWDLSLAELAAEVSLRQSSVLRPQPGSTAAVLPVHIRQRRLRVARSVLAERTAAVGFPSAAASDGIDAAVADTDGS